MKSRSRLMLEKSIAAMLSAIEIYNKPDFRYREDTFSVLCINSWELLLKAKVLNLASNNPASIYVHEYRTLKSGAKSKVRRRKINRAGNPMSISLFQAYRIIEQEYGVKIEKSVYDNLEALTEIRDNAIHFVNDDFHLAVKIQELGSASLRNYFHLATSWFGDVLSEYNFYLMPLSFFRSIDQASAVSLNASERKVLNYIKNAEQKYDDESELGPYNLTLRIDMKFHKGKSDSAFPVQIVNDPNATAVRIAEEDITEKYPWDYKVLSTRLSKRYKDFKMNSKYHRLRKALEKNKKFAYERLLNPANAKGGRKIFYNPNIQKEFDKHYTRAQ